MYDLPQASIIAQDLLTKQLNKVGYHQSKITLGYWRHDWQPISFTLVVDDFGVKYINRDDVGHLISSLSQDCAINTDWDRTWYLRLTLDWDYLQRNVHLSMPGYIENALIRFGHKNPDKPQMQPYLHTTPTYGKTYNMQRQLTHHQLQPKQRKRSFDK